MGLRALIGLQLCAVVLLSGCAAVGPPRLDRDRLEYNVSITESWKRQVLLNIVKIRYVEPIFFMDIGEVVTSYSMETGGNLGASGQLFDGPDSDVGMLELGGSARYTDRPTITYRPLTGKEFFHGVMAPLPLHSLLVSIDSGVSVPFVMHLAVRSINGFRNEFRHGDGFRPADPQFTRAVNLLAALQEENALHIVKGPPVKDEPRIYMTFAGRNNARSVPLRKELQQVLGLHADAPKYEVQFGSAFTGGNALVVQTFSLAQMLARLAGRIDMPAAETASGRVLPGRQTLDDDGILDHVAIRVAQTKPDAAFATVEYRNHWFWIDDLDLMTKRVFSFLMLAFTLMDKGQQGAQLQLTVPTQ